VFFGVTKVTEVHQQFVHKTRWQLSTRHRLCLFLLGISITGAAVAQHPSAPELQTGTIIGTVTDVNEDTVPGATVALEGTSLTGPEHVKTSVKTGDDGFFKLEHLSPGIPYHVTVSAKGFADWSSPEITLNQGQYMDLTGIHLKVAAAITTVNALLSTEELATEQVKEEEKQRVLGFIPNFYVVYDHNAVPLTSKLKFRLAFKTSIDPVTFAGTAFISAILPGHRHQEVARTPRPLHALHLQRR
jgi:hypothetical protein